MAKKYNIAIVGATGAVGTAMIDILEESSLPLGNLFFVASERSKDKVIKFRGTDQEVHIIEDFDFEKIDIAMFSAGAEISEKYVPIATKSNTIVIDNTSQYRYKDDIPLIVPEVNANVIPEYKNAGIIANPNCSTIQMLVAIKPIHDVSKILRINVSTYQAVSGTGNEAIDELNNQIKSYIEGNEIVNDIYPEQIAFNVIPHCDVFMENGYTKEEMKMVWETKKILDNNIQVNATAVRVPVFFGHSESNHLELENKLKKSDALNLLRENNSILKVFDESDEKPYPTALDSENSNFVYVGRVREDISIENGINMWVVANNIRKGAAYNSIQIAEILIAKYL